MMIDRIFASHLFMLKLKIWLTSNCSGLVHEIMVHTVCFIIHLQSQNYSYSYYWCLLWFWISFYHYHYYQYSFYYSYYHFHYHNSEWRSGSVSALPCERPGFASRTRLREIIPANNCTMQGQNNWGNWGSPDVMKLWVAWEVLRWLMKFRELCSGGFHPKLVTPPYHGFRNVNTPPNSQNSKRH